MTIEKLPSGNYRIKQMHQGKMYSIVVDYKPSKKQAQDIITDIMRDAVPKSRYNMSWGDAYKNYIELKSNVLSPSTIRGYNLTYNLIPEEFKNTKLNDIDSVCVQKIINDYSSTHSPKSTSNLFGLISAVLKTYRENINLSVKLPQKVKNEPYIPTDNEVARVVDDIRNTRYYIPISLSALGLRRSEVCALTIDDLTDDNKVIINKALVQNENGEWVIKTTKTTDSTRSIYIPPIIADAIREQGYIYDGYPNSILRALHRTQDKLGIQRFTLHKMRHFFVTYAHNELHLSDAQIMDAGGWKSPNVMRSIYRHSSKEDEAKKQIADSMGNLFRG